MKPPLKQGSSDDFQTPPYAIKPLLPYIKKEWIIWEPACGNGNLVNGLREYNYNVIGSDILDGKDFLKGTPENFDCIITNPPFSIKQEFLQRCYLLKKPFALLLPLTTLETKKRQKLFKEFGIEIILFDHRINFETPSGKQDGSWFATAWFTNWLNIGKELTFISLDNNDKEILKLDFS
jgi:hypothetical protein